VRGIFDEAPELYDRARPSYPQQLFDDLAGLTAIGPESRVLEIGCGTGQATVPLAALGCHVVAVEIGPHLADVARAKLARFPTVHIVKSAFEDWEPDGAYDVVFAATAFHWLDPAVRMAKSADVLRPGGALATVATHHVAGGTVEFFADAQKCYERFDPATPPGLRLEPADSVERDEREVVESGRFGQTAFERYEWDQRYTTAEYIDVLLTYSGHRALPPSPQRALLDCIANLIDHRYGGAIVKRYMNELRVAYKT
jgi:SAM-dependent methyltransferase